MAAGDLTTLARAYAWLRLPPGSDDIVLGMAISATSQRIASWCSRTFAVATYAETYDGTGSARLMLRNFPVRSVSSVRVQGRAIQTSGFRSDGRRALDLIGDTFPRGRQNVEVTYEAGYDPIPADLEMACLDWLRAGYALGQRDVADPGLSAIKVGDTEVRFAATASTLQWGEVPMPGSVYAVLTQYQDHLPV